MQEIETLFTDLFHHCYDGVIEIYEVVSEGQQLVSNVAQQESQVWGTSHFLSALSGPSLRFFSMNKQNKEPTKVSRNNGWLFL